MPMPAGFTDYFLFAKARIFTSFGKLRDVRPKLFRDLPQPEISVRRHKAAFLYQENRVRAQVGYSPTLC